MGRAKTLKKQRALALDLTVGHRTLRIITVYFPHSGIKDSKVEALYSALDAEMEEARRRQSTLIMGGNFNADGFLSLLASGAPILHLSSLNWILQPTIIPWDAS